MDMNAAKEVFARYRTCMDGIDANAAAQNCAQKVKAGALV